MKWDLFICHASEDKQSLVAALANSLRQQGLQVWYDDFVLQPGDSLRQSIDHGLSESRCGLVVLSHHFFKKQWPQRELDGLVALARSPSSGKRIVPIWHGVSHADVASYSPTVADLVALDASNSLADLTSRVMQVVQNESLSTRPREGTIQIGLDGKLQGDIDALVVTVEEILYNQVRKIPVFYALELLEKSTLTKEFEKLETKSGLTTEDRRRRLEIGKRLEILEQRYCKLIRGIKVILEHPAIRQSIHLDSSRDIAETLWGFFEIHSVTLPESDQYGRSLKIDVYRIRPPEIYGAFNIDKIERDQLIDVLGKDWHLYLRSRGEVPCTELPHNTICRKVIPTIVNVVMNRDYNMEEGQMREDLLHLSDWFIGLG